MQLMDSIRQHGDKFQRRAHVPKLAVEALVEEDIGDVGGALSIGAATRMGFRLYSHVTPNEKGKPEARISFNGIDLHEEIGPVDHYMIDVDMIT
jgi:hypothetical protein